MLPWTSVSKTCVDIYFCFSGVYLGAELWSHNGSIFWHSVKLPDFSKVAAPCYILTGIVVNTCLFDCLLWRRVFFKAGFTSLHSHQRCLYNGTYFSTCSPVIAIISLFKFCLVNICGKLPHFNLHFADMSDTEHFFICRWATCIFFLCTAYDTSVPFFKLDWHL